jgi:hypothetical protein
MAVVGVEFAIPKLSDLSKGQEKHAVGFNVLS